MLEQPVLSVYLPRVFFQAFTAMCSFLFRPSHSLCWGSLLSSHTQHLASGDPGKIHTGTVWGRVGMLSGSAKVERSWCFLVLSESHREKEGEVHFSSSALVVDFTCFVVASWLLQEDLAQILAQTLAQKTKKLV